MFAINSVLQLLDPLKQLNNKTSSTKHPHQCSGYKYIFAVIALLWSLAGDELFELYQWVRELQDMIQGK